MGRYLLRRLFLIVPTLLGVMVINFVIVQFAPGGPVEQAIIQASGMSMSSTASVSSAGSMGPSTESGYTGSEGLDPEFVARLEKAFGFDKPPHERFLLMLGNYITLDFGESYFQDKAVLDLVVERLPVSVSLGLWSLLLIYSISIPLGMAKAVRDGTPFDVWSSATVFVAYAIPGFLFAIMLIVFFAGGTYLDWFPMRDLFSENFEELSPLAKVRDYFWHLALPLTALTIGGFATLTMLTKNSFLEEINKQFVLTARAKGLTERRVLFGHVFRNGMLIVIAGFPAAFVGLMFTGALLIEVIFSIDGIGLLGYEAIVKRDYPIFFGTLFCFTLIGLVMQLIGDIVYTLVDPRIDFEARE
ncbi:MAG: microcin C ABC transporter permease YejB [Pseudomonadota bacterium]|uniref:ABC transmembrane type-1 domain-containing protein n=1 Tax=marine metagenome TaxID=408172 RepID=A0A381P614_9ZZZZ|nr:microcin C ABC transporter permease YejB [Pseudomonadota bacterium]HBP13962.1 microcin ABC transporter permease [Gammaproteobacteria bacterium]|tara:strand:- start:1733 stop:2806 length:1074 start_codon:yes stop_codon:yes gene_type:complete